jgi:cephalosporin hydroxylase
MKITIDTAKQKILTQENDLLKEYNLYSKEAFEIISNEWIKIGWNLKYPYTFTWLGRPIIQLPEDMVRIQEVIYKVKPDVIIETGVAHGGSLIFYASLCKAMEKGRVIGIDIDIRPQNKKEIESHQLSSYITLIEGSSTDSKILESVKNKINGEDTILVILDSCHSKLHVTQELEMYSKLVSSGSYIIATDGIMKELHDVPNGDKNWIWDNPSSAAIEFSKKQDDFCLEQPSWLFNESQITTNITHWPNAYLRKI